MPGSDEDEPDFNKIQSEQGIYHKSYLAHRQLSADIKRKNYKIKTSFVSSKGLKAWASKTGIKFRIFFLIFVESCLKYNTIHNFTVWPRTGSNPADINLF